MVYHSIGYHIITYHIISYHIMLHYVMLHYYSICPLVSRCSALRRTSGRRSAAQDWSPAQSPLRRWAHSCFFIFEIWISFRTIFPNFLSLFLYFPDLWWPELDSPRKTVHIHGVEASCFIILITILGKKSNHARTWVDTGVTKYLIKGTYLWSNKNAIANPIEGSKLRQKHRILNTL